MSPKREAQWLLGIVAIIFVALGVHPQADRFTWFMENVPAIIAAPILMSTYRRFPFSRMVYRLIAIHAVILMVGGYYTYAKVPLGFWMQDIFHFTRNHYDRIGHFVQGFVPALVLREFLIRKGGVKRGLLLSFLCVGVALGISAFYEFFEWWTALATETGAEAFLGTQGDIWDTQSDMFMAMVGAILAMIFFSRTHDRSIAGIQVKNVLY